MKTEQEIRKILATLKLKLNNFPSKATNVIDIFEKNWTEAQIQALEFILESQASDGKDYLTCPDCGNDAKIMGIDNHSKYLKCTVSSLFE